MKICINSNKRKLKYELDFIRTKWVRCHLALSKLIENIAQCSDLEIGRELCIQLHKAAHDEAYYWNILNDMTTNYKKERWIIVK